MVSKQRKWNSSKWACWFWDKVHHSWFYFQVLIWYIVNTWYVNSVFTYTWLFSFSVSIFSFTNPCYSFLSPCFCKLRHHLKYSLYLFHFISEQYFTSFFVNSSIFHNHVNTTLFSNIITGVNDMVLLCLQKNNNVFLANGVKCWNLFTHSTKSSDSCFTITFIPYVIQWL